jgi:hypothetical protein
MAKPPRTIPPRDRIFVGEDADDIGAALDLAVEAFQRFWIYGACGGCVACAGGWPAVA